MITNKSSQILKGFAALWVVIFHLSQLTNFIFGPLLHVTTRMHVGLFFFLSGYGLSTGFDLKQNVFFNFFWLNRIFKVFNTFFCY
jgi:peptidoglycan/LPS O-acetylase OafA/YrhL